jgi:hypothetical protein
MNCEQCRAWMMSAVTDGLSDRQRSAFEAHVQECAGCREEYERVRALLEAIDHGVMAQAIAEPSPEFVARVRRRIAAEDAPAKASWLRWAPVAAAVTVAVFAGGLWMMQPRNSAPRRVATNASAVNQPATVNHRAPTLARSVAKVTTPKPKPEFASVRRAAMPKRQRIERGPEVLVPPGQGKALLQFAALLRNGKLDGARLIAEEQKTGQLIEIKPLVIAPLESPTEEENKSSGTNSDGTQKDFVSGALVQSLEP